MKNKLLLFILSLFFISSAFCQSDSVKIYRHEIGADITGLLKLLVIQNLIPYNQIVINYVPIYNLTYRYKAVYLLLMQQHLPQKRLHNMCQ